MLAVTSLLAGDVPVRHPAELLAIIGLQNDQKRVEGDFFGLLAEPRFQLVGKEGRDDAELAVPRAQLKVETDVEMLCASAERAVFGSDFGEVVKSFKKLVMDRRFLMTLNAVKILCSHV